MSRTGMGAEQRQGLARSGQSSFCPVLLLWPKAMSLEVTRTRRPACSCHRLQTRKWARWDDPLGSASPSTTSLFKS